MAVEAWYEGNDMLVRASFADAVPVPVTGLTAELTIQHPDETEVTILGGVFTWPLAMPEDGVTGAYEVVIDRLALDIVDGDKIRLIVDLYDGAGLELQWVRIGEVLERTGA